MRSCACSTMWRRRVSLARSASSASRSFVPTSALPGRRAPGLEVRAVPRDDAVQAIEQVLLFTESMRFARIEHEVCVDAVPLEPAVELLTLPDRIRRVVFALQQQRRRLDVLDEGHRRTLDEAVEFLVRRSVEPLVVRRAVFSAELARHVDDGRA